jgi:putative tricarboxylic transport membrane protein
MGRDGVIGLIIVVMSILLLYNTTGIPTPPIVPLGPAFYPQILLALLLIMGMILFILDISKRKPSGEKKEDKKKDRRDKGWLIKYKKIIWGFVVFGLYILFIPIIGFYSTTAIVLVVLQGLLGYREFKQLPLFFVISIVTTVCIYLIFEKYLMVVFPKGRLF